MERVLSPEEKIRRAEEIYYRRKTKEGNRNYARVNVAEPKKDFTLFKKMLLRILICAVIYTIFYMIKNTEYIFSEDVISKTKEILAYDINLPKLYEQAKNYLSFFTNQSTELSENKIEEQEAEKQNVENLEQQENIETVNEESQETSKEPDGIGGENVEEAQEVVALTQMEQDANAIKETKSLIIPLKGTITSRFGPRESENPIVTKNHTGIDIAAIEGTVFVAAMSGTVEEVSSVRRIRKSYKNCK